MTVMLPQIRLPWELNPECKFTSIYYFRLNDLSTCREAVSPLARNNMHAISAWVTLIWYIEAMLINLDVK